MKNSKDHYRGCLIGGAVGDAMGWPLEFLRLDKIRAQYGGAGLAAMQVNEAGVAEITDDTQMTLFTAEGILRAQNRRKRRDGLCHSPSIVYRAYLRWFDTQYGPGAVKPEIIQSSWLYDVPELHVMRAPGHACITTLRSGVMGKIDQSVNDSKGCGGVMRMAPIGLAAFENRFQIGCECAAITHGHPSGYLTAGILAETIHGIMVGQTIEEALYCALDIAVEYKGHEESVTLVKKAMTLVNEDIAPLDAIQALGEGWVGEEALAIAVYCSLKFQSDFKMAILTAVNHDGDSDSTGAITGNILGAFLGVGAIPKEWLAVLELKNVVVEMADDLFRQYDDNLEWNEKYPGY